MSTEEKTPPYLEVGGELELHFTVTVHDGEALRAYMAQYPDVWTDERSIIKSIVWTTYTYNERREPAGCEGFADFPEGVVSVKWQADDDLSIYHEGEWW